MQGTTHADYFDRNIPVKRCVTNDEINGDYELHTGMVIVERFNGLDECEIFAVLVNSHGSLTWGKDAMETVYHAAVLEIIAEMVFNTQMIKPEIQPGQSELLKVILTASMGQIHIRDFNQYNRCILWNL